MDLALKDKVALVTAASKGLGKAAAFALAREGAKLCICSRSEAIYDTAAQIYVETGADVLPVIADITRQEDVERVVQAALERFGQLDILVANAGGPPPGSFFAFGPEDWEKAVQLTLMSVVRLCYAVVPHMVERGSGSIVAIQSYSVKLPIDNLILSNSIRMAVIGLMKSLANELGPKGIRVNTINPAWTETERVTQLMTNRAAANRSSIEAEMTKITREVPLGRMGSPEEFGKTIAWLVSPAASFIHGHALLFDGGATKTAL